MKDIIAKIIFIICDMLIIALSIYLAYLLRTYFESYGQNTIPLEEYIYFSAIYIIPIFLFTYEGIYTYRYDFWHESRLVLKAILFSAILMFAYLAMTKSIGNYSRLVIGFTFICMSILIPLSKNILKKLLYRLGLWQKSAIVYGDDTFLSEEIYKNPYLGYVPPIREKEASTIFINSKNSDVKTLKNIISSQIKSKHEVIFVPLIDDYNLTYSHIYELFNTKTNLIVFKNKLKSKYRLLFKTIADFIFSLLIFPFLIPLMLMIAYKIKRDDSNTKIFFKQKRLGKNAKPFSCYKFQTMYEDGETILEKYLQEHPEEVEYYEIYHKYKNDPRITKIGHFLRKTSLDELPQVFNIFRGDMSFIGPRPYMIDELEKISEHIDSLLSVKPGITGLWQVSGRNHVDFKSRVALDVWYIRNWSLWLDIVILFKTIKTVLKRDGAY